MNAPYQAKEYFAVIERQAADRIQAIKDGIAESKRQAQVVVDGANMLVQAGFTVSVGRYNLDGITLRVEQKQLVEVVRAIGQLKEHSRHVNNSRKRLVNIYLESISFPGVKVCYTMKLPKEAKCKIVRVRQSYSSLVCESR